MERLKPAWRFLLVPVHHHYRRRLSRGDSGGLIGIRWNGGVIGEDFEKKQKTR